MRTAKALFAVLAALSMAPAAQAQDVGWTDFINFGCELAWSPANGCAISDVKGPVAPGGPGIGTKTGQACGWNVLALFAWGDMRIETAAKEAGITEITSVDHETWALIPFFYGVGRYCTVVSGN